jgi:5-formyltetrahydrofolate cyclo-ligase
LTIKETQMKEAIRSASLQTRDAKPIKEIEIQSWMATVHLTSTPEFARAGSVLAYASFRSEVQTRALLTQILQIGKRLYLPVIAPDKRLSIAPLASLSQLALGPFDIPIPGGVEPIDPKLAEIDLIIVPGVAFDERGARLGYGSGYYDRFLSQFGSDTPVIGLAFDTQVVAEIPEEPGDRRVDMIVTDKRIIHCTS